MTSKRKKTLSRIYILFNGNFQWKHEVFSFLYKNNNNNIHNIFARMLKKKAFTYPWNNIILFVILVQNELKHKFTFNICDGDIRKKRFK